MRSRKVRPGDRGPATPSDTRMTLLRGCCPRIRRGALLGVPIITLVLVGCVVARSAGGSAAAGAVARLSAEDSVLIALERRLADSAGAFLRREFAGAVLDPARETWAAMRRGVRDEADSAAVHVAAGLRQDLNYSLQQLLGDNLAVLDARASQLARAVADAFVDALSGGLTGQLATAGDTLTARIMGAVAMSLQDVLRPALHTVMLDVRDSLRVRIGDVDRAVAESQTLSGVRFAVIGAGVAVLLAILLVAGGHWRRQRRALHAMIDAIETTGDDGVRHAVRSCAEEAGVHGWLTDRVTARRRSCSE